jgi:site-specific recombinase XerD
MNTRELVEQYLAARRAQGTALRSAERMLMQFARETGNRALTDVTPEAVAAFLRGRNGLTSTWSTRYGTLSGLYRYAVARGHACMSALPEQRPQLPPPIPGYVYSHDEVRRMLDAAAALHSAGSPLQSYCYRTLLLLLYATGLRVSEALALNCDDLNAGDRLLLIRQTKFYKSRWVPMGVHTAQILDRYKARRGLDLPMPQGRSSALFASRTGRRMDYQRVVTLFQRVRADAGITCPPGQHRLPRLHDLRHTAAVHRVEQWYRDGKDVQQLLPQLATYLGHVSVVSTQRYLQMTSTLLQRASDRFAAYAGVMTPAESGGNHA